MFFMLFSVYEAEDVGIRDKALKWEKGKGTRDNMYSLVTPILSASVTINTWRWFETRTPDTRISKAR